VPDWVQSLATVVTAAVAIAALAVAWLARRDSHRSAEASAASAKAAAESVAVAQRDEARQLERTDVKWERLRKRGEDHSQVVYRNAGTTPAFQVAVVLTINDARVTVEADMVEPGGSISYDATGMGRRVVIAASYGPDGANRAYGTRYTVIARITWQSKLGTPGVWSDAC
jgi:hypothetical protein